jgi:signal transduction histidine kinase
VTDDVLDLSTIEVGGMTIESYAFDLRNVIEDVTMMSMPTAKRKGVALVVAYPSNIPDFFVGDGGRIRQVIFNLVGNAVKFTSDGAITVAVCCEARTGRLADIRIAVTDSGIGISSEKIASLFERFGPAHMSTARKYGGTGIGLAISRKLVELMGGSIHVESQVGTGSTLWFRLPLTIETDRNSASSSAPS